MLRPLLPWLPAVVMGVVLSAACSDDPIRPDDDDGSGGATSTSSSSSSSSSGTGGGGGVPEGPIVIGPTSGTLALPFSFSAQGSGVSFVGSASIDQGTGSVELGNQTLPVVVYERQPFEDYFLYQALALAGDRLYVLWFYCLGGELLGIYYEGTDGTVLTTEAATGACAESDSPSTAAVQLPGLTMPFPQPLPGYTFSGPDIWYDGLSSGSATIQGTTYALIPFDDVDCSLCGEPPWFEVHALLWDGERVCFAIFYLIEGEPLLVTYVLCLPDLTDPIGSTLIEATFSR
ncbi:MAG: hypothetical protein DRI90_16160 [Deltaproteobacteria bacterium]|nr:MAG: hypothetical protein DRI90_16160 [Deltaproteobacteria bacterium]